MVFSEMQNTIKNIFFLEGLPENLNDDSFIDTRYPSLIIIDDLMRDATNSKDVCELFVEGSHHSNVSVACIMQNAFSKGRESRTMNINSQYVVLFKNPRDQVGPAIFARQMYPNNPKKFMDIYTEGTKRAYGYLFIDLKQNTPEEDRLKTDIFKDESNIQTGGRFGDVESQPVDVYIRDDTELNAQSVDNHESINMEKQPSCVDCGLLFSTPFDVQRHVKRGCPFEEEEHNTKKMKHDESIDTEEYDEEDSIDDDDDTAFDPLIDDVYKKLEEDYQKKVDTLMTEQNLSEKQAKDAANEHFLPRERKLLMKEYKTLITRMYALKKSPLHIQITEVIQNLMEQNGYSFDKATSIVLKRNEHLFEDLIEDDDESDVNSENSDDDDSDDYESDNIGD